jgi:hypothetical protein
VIKSLQVVEIVMPRDCSSFPKDGYKKYENGFKLTIHEYAINFPLKIKEPKMIFVNSMSDLFPKDLLLVDIFSDPEREIGLILLSDRG